MSSQMANFLDQAGGLWARGALNGKVGGAFTSTATQHGGQEVTLFSILTNLMHFGLITVGLPYSFQGQMTLDEITGGSPYGASTLTGRSEEHTSELQSLMRISYAVFCLKKKTYCIAQNTTTTNNHNI